MKTILIAVLFALTLSTTAQANYWVEPVVGYTQGKLSFGSETYDTNGLYYGLRGGTFYKGIKLGGSVMTGSTEINAETTSDAGTSQLGVYAGADLIPKFNIFAEYFFSSSMSFDNSNAKWKSNLGYKTGFLYSGFPLFTLGLNYKMVTYNDTDESNFDGTPLTDDPKMDAFEVVVGMRF